MSDFGWALAQMQTGHAVKRSVWPSGQSIRVQLPDDLSKMTWEYIYVTLPGDVLYPWTASNPDLLMTDWVLA